MYSVCVYNLYTVLFIVYMLIITIYFKRICTNVIYIIYIVLEARGESVTQHCRHQLHLGSVYTSILLYTTIIYMAYNPSAVCTCRIENACIMRNMLIYALYAIYII